MELELHALRARPGAVHHLGGKRREVARAERDGPFARRVRALPDVERAAEDGHVLDHGVVVRRHLVARREAQPEGEGHGLGRVALQDRELGARRERRRTLHPADLLRVVVDRRVEDRLRRGPAVRGARLRRGAARDEERQGGGEGRCVGSGAGHADLHRRHRRLRPTERLLPSGSSDPGAIGRASIRTTRGPRIRFHGPRRPSEAVLFGPGHLRQSTGLAREGPTPEV